jgi:hypothetical protein
MGEKTAASLQGEALVIGRGLVRLSGAEQVKPKAVAPPGFALVDE